VIPAIDSVLDYKFELFLVTPRPLPAAGGAKGGLLLCNDVTDRAAQAPGRNLDLAREQRAVAGQRQ